MTGDTQYTPVPKDPPGGLWTQVGGVPFGETRTPKAFDAQTAYDTDFFSVSFHDADNGFVAGAGCRRQSPDQPVSPGQTDGCERVPVIWRYTNTEEKGIIWREVYRGDQAGFAGALTWLGPNKAIAVGGTGLYPRRELTFDPLDPSGRLRRRRPDQGRRRRPGLGL